MAEVTKCFFQIILLEAQRVLNSLLWFENNDVNKGKLVPFCFFVHPWDIKSSLYIVCLAIKKMVEQNPCKTSDLMFGTVSKEMFVDDFIFSADSFDDVQLIANEVIALFRSRGFELVKWNANKESSSSLFELFVVSIRQRYIHIGHTALALTLSFQVFS